MVPFLYSYVLSPCFHAALGGIGSRQISHFGNELQSIQECMLPL